MAKIFAPNKQYTGISASVSFSNGTGETDDSHLLEWFEMNGYTVVHGELSEEAHGESMAYGSAGTADAAAAIQEAAAAGTDAKPTKSKAGKG